MTFDLFLPNQLIPALNFIFMAWNFRRRFFGTTCWNEVFFLVWRMMMMPPRAGCHSRLCHIIVNRCLSNEHVWRRSFAQQTNLNRPCWSLCGQWLGSLGRHRWSWWHFYTLSLTSLWMEPLCHYLVCTLWKLSNWEEGGSLAGFGWVWLPTIQNRWLLDVSDVVVWPHKAKSSKKGLQECCSLIWVLNFLAASLLWEKDWLIPTILLLDKR